MDFLLLDIFTFQSSFDFGGSFMDEVLKALNEKESQLESSNEKRSSSSKEDLCSPSGERSLSLSPPKEVRSLPPPLPTQPPRVVSKKNIT